MLNTYITTDDPKSKVIVRSGFLDSLWNAIKNNSKIMAKSPS